VNLGSNPGPAAICCEYQEKPTKARPDGAFGGPGLFPTWRGAPLESVDYNATITVCAVPPNSMHRQVDGRCGIEFGPLNIS